MIDRFDVDRRKILKSTVVGTATLFGIGSGSASAQESTSSAPTEDEYDRILSEMEGDGSKEAPFTITNVRELQAIAGSPDANFVLERDIDASDTNQWNGSKGFTPVEFQGNLDGQNYAIQDILIDRPDSQEIGLFSNVYGATIQDIELKNTNITGGDGFVGGLAGRVTESGEGGTDLSNITVGGSITGSGSRVGILAGRISDSTAEECVTNGTVVGNRRTGGLFGQASGDSIVRSCKSTATVSQRPESTEDAFGGLIGDVQSSSRVVNSSATGDVTGHKEVGGLVGQQFGVIKDSRAHGNVEATDAQAGGLVGIAAGRFSQIEDSHATGNVTSNSSSAGGLVGIYSGAIRDDENEAFVSRCFATGAVDGRYQLGGLIGRASEPLVIRDSYATGSITGQDNSPLGIGGLVGNISEKAAVRRCYAVGAIDTNGETIGGLIGSTESGATVETSYWDKNTTNQDTSAGLPDKNGLTTEEMQGEAAKSTLTGFDFADTWQIVSAPDSYPELQEKPNKASFDISILTPDDGAEIDQDEDLKVTVEVTNTSGASASQPITLVQPVERTNQIELSSGSSGTVQFTISANQLDNNVRIVVESGSNRDSVTITAIDPCFIATAAYDTPHAGEIDVLRAFRDDVLNQSTLGQLFVKAYYRTSPPVASWIRQSPRRRSVVRKYFLVPLVEIVDEYINRK